MNSNFALTWATYIQPLLTPTVALVGALSASFVAWRFGSIQAAIARQQAATALGAAETARKKLKLELFDRRLKVHEELYSFIRELPGLPAITDFTPYFQGVSQVRWLFEKPIAEWVYGDLFAMARDYQQVKIKLETLVRDGRGDPSVFDENLKMQKAWFQKFDELASLFDPYLRLEH